MTTGRSPEQRNDRYIPVQPAPTDATPNQDLGLDKSKTVYSITEIDQVDTDNLDHAGKTFFALSRSTTALLIEEEEIFRNGGEVTDMMKIFRLGVMRTAATVIGNDVNRRRHTSILERLVSNPSFAETNPLITLKSSAFDLITQGNETAIDGYSVSKLLHDLQETPEPRIKKWPLAKRFDFLLDAVNYPNNIATRENQATPGELGLGVLVMRRTAQALISLDAERDVFSLSDIEASESDKQRVKPIIAKSEELVVKMNALRNSFNEAFLNPNHPEFGAISESFMSSFTTGDYKKAIWAMAIMTGGRVENTIDFYRKIKDSADKYPDNDVYAKAQTEIERVLEEKHAEIKDENDVVLDSELGELVECIQVIIPPNERDITEKARRLKDTTYKRVFGGLSFQLADDTDGLLPNHVVAAFSSPSAMRIMFGYGQKSDGAKKALFVNLDLDPSTNQPFDWNVLAHPDERQSRKEKVLALSDIVLDYLIQREEAQQIRPEDNTLKKSDKMVIRKGSPSPRQSPDLSGHNNGFHSDIPTETSKPKLRVNFDKSVNRKLNNDAAAKEDVRKAVEGFDPKDPKLLKLDVPGRGLYFLPGERTGVCFEKFGRDFKVVAYGTQDLVVSRLKVRPK